MTLLYVEPKKCQLVLPNFFCEDKIGSGELIFFRELNTIGRPDAGDFFAVVKQLSQCQSGA